MIAGVYNDDDHVEEQFRDGNLVQVHVTQAELERLVHMRESLLPQLEPHSQARPAILTGLLELEKLMVDYHQSLRDNDEADEDVSDASEDEDEQEDE